MSFKESNCYKHAINEFKIAGYNPIEECESGPDKWIQENVLELLEVFYNQGHSGFSSNYCINYFKKLAGFNLLTPLTFNADEFHQVHGNVFQNKRLSSVFKENENSQPYYIDAIVWKSQNGSCFTGTVDGISSKQYIKVNKPFIPKTFYIDVFEYEVNKETNQLEEGSGWWESEIKDNKQLNEVFEYYDFYSNDKN